MSNFANRYAANGRSEMIPVDDVYRRVLAAILTLEAHPSVTPPAMKSTWPAEFEHHAEAIKLAVFRGDMEDKKFRKLLAKDFDDIHLDWSDDDDRPRRFEPTKAQISDAIVAGDWFAKIALLRDERYCTKERRLIENVDQFEARLDKFRAGETRSFLVDDQKILVWLAKGFSLAGIGLRLGFSEHDMERRNHEIRRSLFKIANRTARLADPEQRARDRHRKAHRAESAAGDRTEGGSA